MAFISFEFAAFFGLVTIVHFALPLKYRWIWLLASSIVFCGWTDPRFLINLTLAAAVTYFAAIEIEAAATRAAKQRIITWAILALIANIAIFKYTSFLNESFRSLFAAVGIDYPVPHVHLILPLGISFYTFLLIGYLVDVFRGTKAERHPGIFALFVTFFPKFVSGPIERSRNLLPQLHAPQPFDAIRVLLGLQLILWGVFKKTVVADRIGPFVDRVYNNPTQWDGVAYAAATFLYAFQIYCDFSGYTYIALGAAAILGYELLINFNQPYFATSIQDFWKRWHISLTSWLTDYIYTPLTRQRKFKIKFYTMMLWGLLFTFVVSGLWHGAHWNFVAWGALHGCYIVGSLLFQKPRNKFNRWVGLDKWPRTHHGIKIGVTFVLVCAAYVLFRANSLGDAAHIFAHIFTGWGHAWPSFKRFFGEHLVELLLAIAGIIVVIGADILCARGVDARTLLSLRPPVARWGLYYAGLVTVLLFGAFYGASQQFIYFRF